MKRKFCTTALGWQIKRKLAELNMTQKEFCEEYRFNKDRLSNIIVGRPVAEHHKQRLLNLLEIEQGEEVGV